MGVSFTRYRRPATISLMPRQPRRRAPVAASKSGSCPPGQWSYTTRGDTILLLGHSKLESTVRYLGIEVDDALEILEQTEI